MTTSFNKAKHEYLIDGKPATGVTTVISVLAKPQLIGWAARMAVEHIDSEIGERYRDEKVGYVHLPLDKFIEILEAAKSAHTKKKEAAGQIGTDTHTIVETWITLCLEKTEGRPQVFAGFPAIDKFVGWAQENVDHFLFAERQMYCGIDKQNLNRWVAGTADFGYIGKDGRKYIGDLKTAGSIYYEMWIQVAAYRWLAEDEGDKPYDGQTIIRLGKDNSFEAQQRYSYETDKDSFFACLTLYRNSKLDLTVK